MNLKERGYTLLAILCSFITVVMFFLGLTGIIGKYEILLFAGLNQLFSGIANIVELKKKGLVYLLMIGIGMILSLISLFCIFV